MPVSTVLTVHRYKPGAAMLPEPIPFPYLSAADLVVTHVAAATGVRTVLAAGFAFGGSGEAKTGTIRSLTAWPANDVFEVARNTALIQPADVKPHLPVPAEDLTRQLDRMAMAAQERAAGQQDQQARSIMVPAGETTPDLPARVARIGGAKKILAVDQDTGDIRLEPIAAVYRGQAGGSDNTHFSVASLRTSMSAAGTARLVGAAEVPDGAFFYETRNAPYTDDGRTVIATADVPLAIGAWVRQRATNRVSDFGNDRAALQRAIDVTLTDVFLDIDVTVTSDVFLRNSQSLRGAGGRIIVPLISAFVDAVLVKQGGGGVTIDGIEIDASAHPEGACGIRLLNVTDARVTGVVMAKCNLQLESTLNTIDRATFVSDLTIDLRGRATTAVYVSGIRGVAISKLQCFGGREGIGIYNAARRISISHVRSHHHTQDGFVIIDGQEIAYSSCFGFDNGQSGFTTQRQTSGENARILSWTGCHAWMNKADGFDIRGANDNAWGVDMLAVLSACTAGRNGGGNGGCGFFIVYAEGVTLEACTAELNLFQGLFIHTSERTIVKGFRSVSNAAGIPGGANKAGILVFDSNYVQISDPISGNANSAQQDVGLAFTGSSMGGRVEAGDLTNNMLAPFIAGMNAISGTRANVLGTVFFISVTEIGIYTEECIGVPTHVRPKSSICVRRDPGFDPETYISKGGGSWAKIPLAA